MSVNPISNLTYTEDDHLLLSFCTLISLLKGKRLNFQNIFVNVLSNPYYMKTFKKLLCIETEYEVVQIFIQYDPSLASSKYVTKYLNSTK